MLAREAVAPGSEGLARVVAEFGTEVLDADGSLDRSKLAQIVFVDGGRLAALNAIVHPYIARRSAEIMATVPAEAVVVYDVPLLVENNLQEQYDVVVVVDASPKTQLRRLIETRGMSENDAQARMSAQASGEERLAAADEVIVNDSDLDVLREQVSHLWSRLTPAGS